MSRYDEPQLRSMSNAAEQRPVDRRSIEMSGGCVELGLEVDAFMNVDKLKTSTSAATMYSL